jgi:hypothetical protein
MSAIEILAVIGIIGFIIVRQVLGEPLRGKRAVLLPAILTVIGVVNLKDGGHLTSADITWLVAGVAGSAVIGLGFGAITRLTSRDGYLWAQLPVWGLSLWGALVAWRVVVIWSAHTAHAHVAASTSTLLLSLGVNRLAQAAVIVPRAMAAGVPFAPEKDGRVFMAEVFQRGGSTGAPVDERPVRPRPEQDWSAPYGRDDDRRDDRRDRHADRWDRRHYRRDDSYGGWGRP